jgi:RsiW-degrading membrane proteinase PrsW (M82 family)
MIWIIYLIGYVLAGYFFVRNSKHNSMPILVKDLLLIIVLCLFSWVAVAVCLYSDYEESIKKFINKILNKRLW